MIISSCAIYISVVHYAKFDTVLLWIWYGIIMNLDIFQFLNRYYFSTLHFTFVLGGFDKRSINISHVNIEEKSSKGSTQGTTRGSNDKIA